VQISKVITVGCFFDIPVNRGIEKTLGKMGSNFYNVSTPMIDLGKKARKLLKLIIHKHLLPNEQMILPNRKIQD
jgi:hypothetical protein